MRPDKRVSSPTAVTSITTGPRARTRPAWMSSPSLISTGTDSPVSGALSKAPNPSTMRPSAGINSPLRISTWSPIRTSSIGTSSYSALGSGRAHPSAPSSGTGEAIVKENVPVDTALAMPFFDGVTPVSLRAFLGSRSRPPCIALRAWRRASPSR